MKIKAKLFHISLIAFLLTSSQSAYAAFSIAEYLGISSIFTTGTATATVLSETPLDADGFSDFGILDPTTDFVTFFSETSIDGEATATNSGFSATSLASSFDGVSSSAHTNSIIDVEIDGDGLVIMLFEYSLVADASEPGSYAGASVYASTSNVTNPFELDLNNYQYTTADVFSSDFLAPEESAGFLALTFVADGSGPFFEEIYVGTSAYNGQLLIPVPASIWLFSSAILGLATINRRKS